MLSKHPESCRFPHGHTRTIEVVVIGEQLDSNDMLVDFKALKLALKPEFDTYDHAMAINSKDPAFEQFRQQYPPEALVVFENQDPSTEAIAERLFIFTKNLLAAGFQEGPYVIPPGRIKLESLRVWETENTWAEFSE